MPINSIDCCCSDPTTYWSTTTTTGSTMTNLDLSAITSSINITPNNITWTYSNKEQEEYIEKLEKHIDELEEDIEYFNGQLQEKDVMIHDLIGKKDELEKDMSDMNCHIIYLEGRLKALEDKINK